MALLAPVWRERGSTRVVLAVFTAGLVLGGMLSATVAWAAAGLVGWVPMAVRVGALLLVAVLVAGNEAGVLRLRLPQNHRQVPKEIFAHGPYWSSLQFGFELGTGARTYLPSAAPYLLAFAVVLLQAALPVALLAGAAFGLGRAAMAVSRTASVDPPAWDEFLRGRLPLVQGLTGLAGVAVCLALAR
jgi:hypothetical protein